MIHAFTLLTLISFIVLIVLGTQIARRTALGIHSPDAAEHAPVLASLDEHATAFCGSELGDQSWLAL